ncbi:MAG: hypothetical protein HRJ53_04340 [Acidobacteria bacterium Pan2503]|uniref:Uncharacterized protein n=1 Tax=Candidatus Acidiferrum panamense TaxID=2741543 RepID=A0A7V8NMQ6_9BACT|nr:hypothetical protein [Candidatus Acidoferrum panamensis]
MSPSFPTFDVAEIAEEASERAGIEFRAGYALRSARRSMELLSIEWGNRGLNLWTIEETPVQLQQGVNEYVLPDDTIDLIEYTLRNIYLPTNKPRDFPLARLSIDEYTALPDKQSQGRPTVIHVKRRIPPSFLLWQTPDANYAQYQVIYSRLRRMASVGTGGTGSPDMPFRFLPAMIAGVAYLMALKSSDPNAFGRAPLLKAAYEEAFTLAGDEDRDRASVKWRPWNYSIL